MNGAHAYFQEIHAHNLRQYADSIAQFSLKDVTTLLAQPQYASTLSRLIGNGAFSFKGPPLKIETPFYCVIAFPPTSKFHLGYASVLKEAEIWMEYGATPLIILSSCEAAVRGTSSEDLEARIAYSKAFLRDYFSSCHDLKILVDREEKDFLELELQVQGKINIAKLHQLMGKPSEGENLSYYRIPSLMVTTFLLAGRIAQNRDASIVIPLGMNEITYTELAKQVARKMGEKEPTFVFRGQLNDISAQSRMSSKAPEKALHIDETIDGLVEKLNKTVTNAVPPVEGSVTIDRPLGCHFLRLVSALHLPSPVIQGAYSNCMNAGKCKDCKEAINNHLMVAGR